MEMNEITSDEKLSDFDENIPDDKMVKILAIIR